MYAATFPRTTFGASGPATSAATSPNDRASAVRLVDRRTGQTHRVNGSPLVLFTRMPDEAAAELLEGRDASVWEVRVEQIGQGGRA